MKKNNEKGSVILEASMVFPIVLLVIFLLIYVGNVYLQRAEIEAAISKYAIKASSYMTNPLVQRLEKGEEIPFHGVDSKPYRYIFDSDGASVRNEIQQEMNEKLADMRLGMFTNMAPQISDVEVNYHRGLLKSYIETTATIRTSNPIRIFTHEFKYKVSNTFLAPVIDVPELIRNLHFGEDILNRVTKGKYGKYKGDILSKIPEYGKCINSLMNFSMEGCKASDSE